MGKLKGFYFSLDALTASMVLIAAVGMLAAYNPSPEIDRQPFRLDYLHAAAMQDASDWNNSYETDRKVLSQIYHEYYSGNPDSADQICGQYFETSSYALYFTNSSERDKVCGSLDVSNETDLHTGQTPVPDIKVNNSFGGPKTAIMVVNN